VLDPERAPNGDVRHFERDGDDHVLGYRTANSPVIRGGGYETGKTYTAPVFSTCSVTDCHPGLFLCPTIESAQENGKDIIKVRALAKDVHKTPSKWRCREFTVLEEVSP